MRSYYGNVDFYLKDANGNPGQRGCQFNRVNGHRTLLPTGGNDDQANQETRIPSQRTPRRLYGRYRSHHGSELQGNLE